MSRRRRQGLSPSLFPFLAVLVCTLGTLILLLALVAQNATESAEQQARAQQRVAEAKLKAAHAAKPGRLTAKAVDSMIAEERFRVTQLVAFRNKQTADLEQRRDQLTHMEDHLERLRTQLKRLSDEVDNAMGESSAKQIDEDTIVSLRTSIDAERAAVEQLRSDSATKTPRVVIVPHKGPNGTDRRPVYLECDSEGVTIWPEGSRITTAQLVDSTNSANPLDAALRSVRYHALQTYGDTTPPYPLLVVRPDGIETYGAARSAMLDWDDQFGYELVPADVKLAFAKPDANLRQRIDIAIRDAVAKQYARSAIAHRGLGGRGGDGRGGYGSRAGSRSAGPRKRLPTLSAASLDRDGRANGFRSAGDDFRAGSSQLGRSPYTRTPPSASGSRFGPQSNDALRGGTYGGSYANMDPSASTRELANQMQAAAREMRQQQASNSERDRRPGSQNTDMHNSGVQMPGSQGTGLEGTVSDTAASQRKGAGPYGQAQGDLAENSGGTDGDQSPGELGGPSNAPANESGGPPSGAQGESSQTASSTQHNPSASETGNSSQESSGPNSSATASQSGSSMSMPQQQASAPSAQISMNATPRADLVQRQGRDWALPANVAGMGGNSIVRTLRVHCYRDRLVLLPPSTGGATEMFGFSDGDVDRASLELATAVRDRVDRWGAALPGGRWQPRLDVEVKPGGEERFHQLQSLMSGSGVDVTGRASQ